MDRVTATTLDREASELEPTISERDSTPKPRRKETTIQLERRVDAMERVIRPIETLVSDAQVDDMVRRISEGVISAVMEHIKLESKKVVRQHMAEAFKDIAFGAGKLST